MSNQRFLVSKYAALCEMTSEREREGDRDKKLQYALVAAMVGDVHRILCRGGIFYYPGTKKTPSTSRKLRLCNESKS